MGITCKTAVDYISKKEEGKLTFIQQYHLWRHLSICYLCKRFKIQNKLMINSFKHHAQSSAIEQHLNLEEKQVIIKTLKEHY